MTKRQLRQSVVLAIAFYATGIALGFVLSLSAPVIGTTPYSTYRDMVWFLLAIPAASLGYIFQQRVSYLASLRALWSKLVQAVNLAIQYTYDEQPTLDKHAEVLLQLRIVIDEVRGVYRNVGEMPGHIGLYPYEPIKQIYSVIYELGHGRLDDEHRKHARNEVIKFWQSIRFAFLSEFDRAEPENTVAESEAKLAQLQID